MDLNDWISPETRELVVDMTRGAVTLLATVLAFYLAALGGEALNCCLCRTLGVIITFASLAVYYDLCSWSDIGYGLESLARSFTSWAVDTAQNTVWPAIKRGVNFVTEKFQQLTAN